VLDNIFTQANLDNGTFRNFSYLQTYAVDKFINSAFGELTYGLAEKTTANLGLKADYVDFKISYNVNQGAMWAQTVTTTSIFCQVLT
jgi:hypothetical protein